MVTQKANLGQKKFQLIPRLTDGSLCLMIIDVMWWIDNEREVLNWMTEILPQGIDHLEGMVLKFDNDYDRINFLMRWGP
jgi:hypothetical protein